MQRFRLRPLELTDIDKGFLSLLFQLTTVGSSSREALDARFAELQRNPDVLIQVAEDVESNQIVATGTVLIEPKFIHSCGKVGHIEDVVVDQSCRGTGLGKRLVEELVRWAESQGCYKVILDCAEDNAGFYTKCGLGRKEVQMVKYFKEDS